jgi:hypothetical protein
VTAEKCDPEELGRLLQLILGCAINCHCRQGKCNSNSSHEDIYIFFFGIAL